MNSLSIYGKKGYIKSVYEAFETFSGIANQKR